MAVAADASRPARRAVARRGRARWRASTTSSPLRHTFIDDCETPVSAFLKLRGRDPEFPAFLLESAEQGQRVGRFRFIGVRPRKVVRWSLGDDGDPYALAADGGRRLQPGAVPRARRRSPAARSGFFGYDLVRTVEPLGEPNPDPVGLPDMALMLSDVLVVFDHLKHTITILVNVYADDGELEAAYADALATIEKARRLLAGPGARHRARRRRGARPTFASNMPREQFEAMVARIVEYVHAGDAFQVVPSQRWSADLDARSVLDLPRPAGGQPEPVHVLPGLHGLPDRRRLARAAADRRRPPRLDAPDRRHAPARRRRRRGRA